ncbi:MAG: hypothetical protein LUE14_09890 [Clostridiales bacterium]|nr:hypothetical protein [Clostridiales bacterium]
MLKWFAAQMGVNVSCLSEFCGQNEEKYQHIMILNYSDLSEDVLKEAVCRLARIFDSETL